MGREEVRSSLRPTDAEFAQLQVSPTSLVPTSDIAAISQSGGPALQGAVTFGDVMLVGYNSGNSVSGRIHQGGFVCVPR